MSLAACLGLGLGLGPRARSRARARVRVGVRVRDQLGGLLVRELAHQRHNPPVVAKPLHTLASGELCALVKQLPVVGIFLDLRLDPRSRAQSAPADQSP